MTNRTGSAATVLSNEVGVVARVAEIGAALAWRDAAVGTLTGTEGTAWK